MKKNWYCITLTHHHSNRSPTCYLFDGLDPDMTEVMENVHAKLMAEGITLVEKDILYSYWMLGF